jgi:Importin repeat 6
VIEKTLECIRDLCEELGPGSIINQVDRIVEIVNDLLDKKAFCQTKAKDFKGEVDDEEGGEDFEDGEDEGGDSEEDDSDEDMDHDEIILGNTTDLINALSKSLGDQFLNYFTNIAPRLVRYLDDSHPKSDKVMIIGCLAETFNSCNAAIPVYLGDFVQVLMKHSGSNDSGLNRNCAYAIGIMAEHAKAMFPTHINNFLTSKSFLLTLTSFGKHV